MAFVSFSLMSFLGVKVYVEKTGLFASRRLSRQACGKLLSFPLSFPTSPYTVRVSSALMARTFRSNEGSPAMASSTFRTEWMTVEWSRSPK